MNRLFALILSLFCVVGLFACEKEPEQGESADPLAYDYDLTEYITLPSYLGRTLKQSDVTPTENDLTKQREDDFVGKDVSRAVEDGDTVVIDYVGKLDGVAFRGGSAGLQSLEIGSGTYIDGFEEGLIGVMPGETVDLDLTFPESYGNTELAGKAVVFTVTVRYIKSEDTAMPTLTDELVSALTEYETVAEYESGIVVTLSKKMLRNTVWNDMMTNSTYHKLPEDARAHYRTLFINNYKTMAESYNMDLESFLENSGTSESEFLKSADEYAEGSVQSDLILNKVVQEQGITVTEQARADALDALMETYEGQYPDTDAMAQAFGEENLEKLVLHHVVLEYLCEQVTLTE